jgi:hypothetical protein
MDFQSVRDVQELDDAEAERMLFHLHTHDGEVEMVETRFDEEAGVAHTD